jgi:integrase
MDKLIAQYGLSVEPGTQAYERLRTETIRAHRDYCSSVLEYDRSFESYDFASSANTDELRTPMRIVGPSGLTLFELTTRFTAEGNRGGQWVAKTQMEKSEHIALLHEVLGEKTDVKTITSTDAQSVKSTLTNYPKNRKKNPKTRDLSLEEVLKVADVERLNVRTLNKYLQAYNSLFGWAKRNGYVPENVFEGLAVRQGKNKGKQVRTSFSNEQVTRMLQELLNNDGRFVRLPYQKWGPLIALYTGARLNEIAQMHLADIRMQDGVWCFDINDKGEDKKLKTDASRRFVPIHSGLIALGFVDYVQSLRDEAVTKLFPKFTYCPKNGWGRSLGRWFNDEFLVRMGMKGQGLSFHSFRHTVVTGLMHTDVDLPLIQTLVGHERQGVTHQHYFSSGFKISQLRDALEKLDYSRAVSA